MQGIAITDRTTSATGVTPTSALVTNDDLIVVATSPDSVAFLDQNFDVLYALPVKVICGGVLSGLPVLDVGHNIIILPVLAGSTQSSACAVSASTGGAGLGSLAWGPVPLGIGLVHSQPLVTSNVVWFINTNGTLRSLSTQNGAKVSSSQALMCGDGIPPSAAAITQLDPAGSVVVVTASGCVTAIASNGTVAWHLPRQANVTTGAVSSPPAVDAASGRAYWVHPAGGGALCCVSSATGATCPGWPSVCVGLALAPGALVTSPLALSPDTYDWHGGDVYAISSDGCVVAVRAGTGSVAISSPGTVVESQVHAFPLVVPNAWGQDNNALLVVSCGTNSGDNSSTVRSSIAAFEVGSNGASGDDDAADDDGAATTGFVWRLGLPVDIGCVGLGGGAAVIGSSLLVSSQEGDVIMIGPAHDAVEFDAPWLEPLLTGGVVAIGLVVSAGGWYWGHRHRRRALLADAADADDDDDGDDDLEAEAGVGLLSSEGVAQLAHDR